MKIVFYNIAYGTGFNGSLKHYLTKLWRFFWAPVTVLQQIAESLKFLEPDVLCLAEVDSGSFRNRFRCQTALLAEKLALPFSHSQSKYHANSPWQQFGILRKQHDAVLSRTKGTFKRHHLKSGMKKLVQEYHMENLSIFTVHLAVLSKKVRQKQLQELAEILKACARPHIVCGDFNLHDGLHEIDDFLASTGLRRIEHAPSFPSMSPTKHIDLFLASPDVNIHDAGVVELTHSDHLPVWVKVAF